MSSPTSINLIPSVLRLFVNPSPTQAISEALPKDNYDPIVNIAGCIVWSNAPYRVTYDEPKDFQPPRLWSDRLNVVVNDDAYKFKRLAEQWKLETGHLSFIRQKIAHVAFLEILVMGERALPLLIKAIQTDPNHWFLALRLIAKTNPVRDGASVEEAVIAWTAWWKDREVNYASMDFA
jgi:hypothetical protein